MLLNLNNLLSVIVLYKSSLNDSKTFQTLLVSLEGSNSDLVLLVYNNSPSFWEYTGEGYEGVKIIYYPDKENSGVSKAYNLGYKYAQKYNKKFVLTLDQDTNLPYNFFKNFFLAEKKYRDDDILLFCSRMKYKDKLVSPSFFSYLFKTKEIGQINEGIHSLKGLAIINSGLIISVKLFEKVGGYNELIKLDFSDFDFLKRAEKHINNFVLLDNDCQHMLSGEEKPNKEKSLTRFQYYLDGAKEYQKSFMESIVLFIWVFLRSVNLGFRHKTFSFIFLFFSKILK